MYVFHNKRILTPNCQTYGKTLQNLNLKTRERASKRGVTEFFLSGEWWISFKITNFV